MTKQSSAIPILNPRWTIISEVFPTLSQFHTQHKTSLSNSIWWVAVRVPSTGNDSPFKFSIANYTYSFWWRKKGEKKEQEEKRKRKRGDDEHLFDRADVEMEMW